MNFSPGSLRRGSRKPPPPPPQQSDIYSTFIVHNENKADSESGAPDTDIYATMIHKPDEEEKEDEDEDEDESLPPLLKRLPKDFGLAEENDDFNTAFSSSISGTMIVKNTDSRSNEAKSGRGESARKTTSYWDRGGYSGNSERSYRRRYEDEEDEDEDDGGGDFGTFVVKRRDEDEDEGEGEGGGDFGTFVVRGGDEGEEDVSGTVVRKTARSRGGGGGDLGSTMSRAVASMQAAGEGFGRQRRSGASGKDASSAAVLRRQQGSGKVSTSSIPESVTREDPTTKYEILNELGKNELSLSCIPNFEVDKCDFNGSSRSLVD